MVDIFLRFMLGRGFCKVLCYVLEAAKYPSIAAPLAMRAIVA